MTDRSASSGPHLRSVTRRRLLLGGMAALTTGAAWPLAGCGGSGGSSAGPSVAGAGSPTQAPVPATPRAGGVLRALGPAFGPNPDPHKTRNPSESLAWQWMGNFLYRFSRNEPYLVEPDLAAAMPEIPSDGTLLTVKLRPEAKWQPRGAANSRALTAGDVKATFERIKALGAKSPRAGNYVNLERITAIDPQTVQVKLKSPQADLMAIMADQYDIILPVEVASRGDDAIRGADDLAGTGQYELVSYDAGRKISLKRRSDGPWRPNTAWLDGWDLVAAADDGAKANALLGAQADVADLPPVLARVFDGRDDFHVLRVPQPARECLLINHANARWKDARLRLAVQRAVNRQQVYAAVFEGEGIPGGPMSPAAKAWALTDAELATLPGFGDRATELKEAKALMSAAGVPNGFEETILSVSSMRLDAVTQVIAESLAEIGIRLTVLPQGDDLNVLTERVRKGDFTLATMLFLAGIYPDAQLYLYHHTSGAANYGKAGSKELDAKLDRQRGMYDAAQRLPLVKEIQQDIIKAPGPVWLGSRRQLTVASAKVQNMVATPFMSGFDDAENDWLLGG